MEFIEFLGWVVLFYLTWQLLKSWLFVQQLRHRISDAVAEAELVEEIEKQVIALRFEHVEENGHHVVLAYGKNNKFLGQGINETEVENNLQKYYPKHKLIIVNEKANIQKILDPIQTSNV